MTGDLDALHAELERREAGLYAVGSIVTGRALARWHNAARIAAWYGLVARTWSRIAAQHAADHDDDTLRVLALRGAHGAAGHAATQRHEHRVLADRIAADVALIRAEQDGSGSGA